MEEKKQEIEYIFSKEDDILSSARNSIDSNSEDISSLLTEFSSFANAYESLLKQTKKLVRISDSTQKKLKTVKMQLEELNQNLEAKVKERTLELTRANERLEKLDNAKNYFLGLLSHELNTPLSGITGFTSILKSSVEDDELKEYCDLILESSARLKKFADFSLLITRLRTEKYQLKMQKESISSIISNAVFNIKDKAQTKNIHIEVVLDREFKIFVDRHLVQRVIEIILDNAIKYSDYDKNVIVKVFANEQQNFVEIIDSGKGFTQESIETLFEFFSSDELMHHDEGTGLSMATVKLIMDLHSGKINAKNNEDTGATISLSFPKPTA